MKKKKVKVGILGTGNIGSDLLVKINRSRYLECSMFAGQNPNSENIYRAKQEGINTSADSIGAYIQNPDICDIVFDATTADSHKKHAPILLKLNKFTIDMTPSGVGKMCVPVLNLEECLSEPNVNMVTCGGQATTPIIDAIVKTNPNVDYVEIVAAISSKSAGVGTRNNIDEYTQTTADSITFFTKVKKAKAIIILNPAEPPIMMHNTIYVSIERPKVDKISRQISEVVKKIKMYVPGYKLIWKPVFENNRLTIINEVVGRGDFLPVYAGNLDIINNAAIVVAEEYAKRHL